MGGNYAKEGRLAEILTIHTYPLSYEMVATPFLG
jgi:hypothetical protein